MRRHQAPTLAAVPVAAPALLLLALIASGCSDGGAASPADLGQADLADLTDAPAPADASPDSEPVAVTLPPKGDDGHDDVGAALGAGQARAGRVTAAGQLLTGIKVEGRLGDFKLYNGKVAFIIEDARPSDGSAPFGGELIDAMGLDPRRDSAWGEMVLAVGPGIIGPTSVGVTADGSDGQAAVVRVIGEPALLPQLGGIGAALGGAQPVVIVQEYRLEPDSHVLEIRWRVFNKTQDKLVVQLTAVGISAGDGLRYFLDGVGFGEQPVVDRAHLILAAEGPTGDETPMAGYLLRSEALMSPLVEYEGLMLLTGDALELPPAGEEQRSFTLSVIDGDPESGLRELRRITGEAEPPALSGAVRDHTGEPIAGARVHVTQASAAKPEQPTYVTMTRADAKGRFAVGLAAGEYTLRAAAAGHALSEPTPVTVTSAAATVDLTLGGTATLHYLVNDGDGLALPAKLTLLRTPAADSLPARFGEPVYPGGAALVTAVDGEGEVAVPPGSYSATVSRGFEYELGTATFELTAGGAHQATFVLDRSVNTTGHLSGDLHTHATWSADASDRYRRKAAWLAAEGLEIPVITEHDYVGDLGPAIIDLGLQKWVNGISGDEITTGVFGHFNVYPLVPDPALPNRGAFDWADRSPTELFGEVRAAAPDAVLQVNHPRSASVVGYFTSIGYDPATGKAVKIAGWSHDFDALELFNAKRLPATDWTAGIGLSTYHSSVYMCFVLA